jgi:hypothetical protein
MNGNDEDVATYSGDGAAGQDDADEAPTNRPRPSDAVLLPEQLVGDLDPTSLRMRTPLHRRASGFRLEAY